MTALKGGRVLWHASCLQLLASDELFMPHNCFRAASTFSVKRKKKEEEAPGARREIEKLCLNALMSETSNFYFGNDCQQHEKKITPHAVKCVFPFQRTQTSGGPRF